MYNLNIYLGICLADDSEIIAAVKKSIELPIAPFNGLLIETEAMTLEVNLLGYSLQDNAFFSVIDNDSIDHIDDLDDTVDSWLRSGFKKCEVGEMLKKTQYL